MRTSRRGRCVSARARLRKSSAAARAWSFRSGVIEIFQIDDYGVCAAGHGLIELGFPVSGHEQKRAHGAVLIEVLGI